MIYISLSSIAIPFKFPVSFTALLLISFYQLYGMRQNLNWSLLAYFRHSVFKIFFISISIYYDNLAFNRDGRGRHIEITISLRCYNMLYIPIYLFIFLRLNNDILFVFFYRELFWKSQFITIFIKIIYLI